MHGYVFPLQVCISVDFRHVRGTVGNSKTPRLSQTSLISGVALFRVSPEAGNVRQTVEIDIAGTLESALKLGQGTFLGRDDT
jgi:hypothetical protein